MSRRGKRRTVDDMDDLLPEDLIAGTSGSTIAELNSIVESLEKQLADMTQKYERRIADLTNRLESIESDFKQVIETIKSSSG